MFSHEFLFNLMHVKKFIVMAVQMSFLDRQARNMWAFVSHTGFTMAGGFTEVGSDHDHELIRSPQYRRIGQITAAGVVSRSN